jgi:hypothetical protein
MIITKALAGEIAKSLCAKALEKAQAIDKKNSEIVTGLYLKSIPKAVIDFNTKYTGWINTTQFIYAYDENRNSFTFKLLSPLPTSNTNSFKNKNRTKLLTLNAAYKKALGEYKTLLAETTAAMLKLRTDKRLLAEFPEAAAHLPKGVKASIGIDGKLSETRAKLKALK